jgi:hypothetical protein
VPTELLACCLMKIRKLPAETALCGSIGRPERQPLERQIASCRGTAAGQYTGDTNGLGAGKLLQTVRFRLQHIHAVRAAGLEKRRPLIGRYPPGRTDVATADRSRGLGQVDPYTVVGERRSDRLPVRCTDQITRDPTRAPPVVAAPCRSRPHRITH